MEIREVKIEEYWPLIVKGTAEFGQIAAALNPEFNKLAECIYRVLNESFIQDASEYGVSRWESILGITPAAGATLDDRKAAILTYMNIKLPYTWRVLKQMLVPILGGEDKFVMEYINDECKLVLYTDRLSDDKLQTIADLLEKVVPQNIEILIFNDLSFVWIDPLNTELTDLLDGSQFETAWLADENTLVVHTDRVDNALLAAVKMTAERYMPDGATLAQYNHNMEISWRDINKYAECVTKADMLAVNADYPNDVTSEGEWIYPLTNLNANVFNSTAVNIKRLVYDAPSLNGERYANINGLPNVQEIVINCQSYIGYSMVGFTGRRWNDFVVNCPNLEKITVLALSDDFDNLDRFFYGNTKLKEIEMPKLPKLNNAQEFCLQSQLSKRSVLYFIKEIIINATTGFRNLGLGIHVDHQNDEEVLAAIDAATAKGWTVIVRWNGTPTSGISTTDLEDIYAKVNVLDDEHAQYGEYIDENGNRCSLDWGHIVKSPDGKTPEEMGYVCFYSLVEAEEYFKLTKVENNE